MWLTRLALRNPILILMVSLMLSVLGVVCARRLSVDLFPEITIPVVRVATFYSGAGPADIEKSITQPVERAVAAAPGVERVESTSKQGVSIVSAWFGYGENLDNAQFEVQQRVAQVLNTLPPGIQQPFILKFDITNIPVVQVAVSADGAEIDQAPDERRLYDLAYNVIEPQLERIPGVANATVGGGKLRQVEVKAHPGALRARGLGILDLVAAVRASNLLLPSGSLRAGDRDYNVFANTQVDDPRELRDLIVRPPGPGGQQTGAQTGAPVRLSEVAEVEDGSADQINIVRINGQRGVYLRVLKQPGANTIEVVDAVRAALPRLRGVPAGIKLAISFDQSSYIRNAVRSLEHEALQGGALAIAVILLFLGSLRATGIVSIAIPLSVIATFVLLYVTGQSLNVFTLGGLALGVGRLVDDSIVELENIHRHLQRTPDRKEAVLRAAKEVAMPILVSTITTVVVFLPVLFLRGVARHLFVPLALTISFALFISFLVSRTVTPLLCLSWLKAHPPGENGSGGAHQPSGRLAAALDRLDHGYAGALGWVLDHRGVVIGAILSFSLLSLLLYARLGTEFFPQTDEAQLSATYKTPIGTRVERTEEVGARAEAVVQKALGGLYTTLISDNGLPLGRTALFTSNTGPHAGNLQVNLLPRGQRAVSDIEATERARRALRDALPGVQLYFFTGGIVKRILNFGSPAPIDVEILGYDLAEGAELARAVAARLRELRAADGGPLLTDVQISREENYPELHVTVDRQKAGVLGISEQQVAQTVLASLLGNTQFQPIPFTDPKTGNEYFINVRLADPYRAHVSDLRELALRAPSGAMVSLDTLARVERRSGPVLITRKYMQRIVDVTANVAPGRDLGAAADATREAIARITPPEGFSLQLGGQAQAQAEAFTGLGFAALLAIVLVYMVLASQFGSLLDPLVIMFSVPLGVSGVFVLLYLTGTTLSVNSFMGIIMMVGIVVSNGVLLVDFAIVLRRRGLPLREATIEAGKTRLRPILMTTIATVAGLLPMALGVGEGSETNLPLARAVIGGLTVSTVFTLFLVPALYTLVERSGAAHVKVADEDDA
jgi:hydrophobe/amphiphile efflux-1 (HAE1) family protein